jgi:hypothetical protein
VPGIQTGTEREVKAAQYGSGQESESGCSEKRNVAVKKLHFFGADGLKEVHRYRTF